MRYLLEVQLLRLAGADQHFNVRRAVFGRLVQARCQHPDQAGKHLSRSASSYCAQRACKDG